MSNDNRRVYEQIPFGRKTKAMGNIQLQKLKYATEGMLEWGGFQKIRISRHRVLN